MFDTISILYGLSMFPPITRFGCDVDQFSSHALGIMDTALFDFKKTFGTNLGMSKAQRLQTGDSFMTHAMGT